MFRHFFITLLILQRIRIILGEAGFEPKYVYAFRGNSCAPPPPPTIATQYICGGWLMGPGSGSRAGPQN